MVAGGSGTRRWTVDVRWKGPVGGENDRRLAQASARQPVQAILHSTPATASILCRICVCPAPPTPLALSPSDLCPLHTHLFRMLYSSSSRLCACSQRNHGTAHGCTAEQAQARAQDRRSVSTQDYHRRLSLPVAPRCSSLHRQTAVPVSNTVALQYLRSCMQQCKACTSQNPERRISVRNIARFHWPCKAARMQSTCSLRETIHALQILGSSGIGYARSQPLETLPMPRTGAPSGTRRYSSGPLSYLAPLLGRMSWALAY